MLGNAWQVPLEGKCFPVIWDAKYASSSPVGAEPLRSRRSVSVRGWEVLGVWATEGKGEKVGFMRSALGVSSTSLEVLSGQRGGEGLGLWVSQGAH